MARRLAREEALFAGTASGANIVAALRVAERLGPDACVVTLLPDSGLKCLSMDLCRPGGADQAELRRRHVGLHPLDRICPMKPKCESADSLREILRRRVPRAAELRDLPDELELGEGGLGLDSIGLVELLLACGEHFGLPPPLSLLDGPPLTVGLLAEHVQTCTRR